MSEHARKQAKAQAESISAMVAALNVDYDRLEELREEDVSLRRLCCQQGASKSAHDALVIFEVEYGDELRELEFAAGDCESEEQARERIQEDALEVTVRADWHAVGEQGEPDQFNILLCTGGPAVRIIGELRYGEPYRAWLEYQDWSTPWTEYHGEGVSADDLLAYCRCFYFGE